MRPVVLLLVTLGEIISAFRMQHVQVSYKNRSTNRKSHITITLTVLTKLKNRGCISEATQYKGVCTNIALHKSYALCPLIFLMNDFLTVITSF